MARLDEYRSALLAVFSDVSEAELVQVVDEGGPKFVSFVIDHGLGPLWHERAGRDEFHASRLQAEALYLGQERALGEVGAVLDDAGIEHVIIKGAANRLLIYQNPAVRACYDLDLLVRPDDKMAATRILVGAGFTAHPVAASVSFEMLITRPGEDLDLHWRLLRDGRLKHEDIDGMMMRRRRADGLWMLDVEDALFLLLVHPAIKKHLAGWEMGMHRVADIVAWLRTQSFDWQTVRSRLKQHGVRTAAWATLRWVQMLTHPHQPARLDAMIADVSPGRLRRRWLEWWLRNDLPERLARAHWLRLIGFSLFLHDSVGDASRAVRGRLRAQWRSKADLAEFQELLGE